MTTDDYRLVLRAFLEQRHPGSLGDFDQLVAVIEKLDAARVAAMYSGVDQRKREAVQIKLPVQPFVTLEPAPAPVSRRWWFGR